MDIEIVKDELVCVREMERIICVILTFCCVVELVVVVVVDIYCRSENE